MASLSLPSSSSCSAGVYVDVGMDRSNKYVYDVLHAHSQTEMLLACQNQTLTWHHSRCHLQILALRESTTMLEWIEAINMYMTYFMPTLKRICLRDLIRLDELMQRIHWNQ